MLLRMPPSWAGEFVSLPEADALEHTLEMAGVGVKERGATPDETWTLEITSNRGDLLSAQGLARELGAMENQPVRAFTTQSEHVTATPAQGDAVAVQVEIEDAEGCPRYSAQIIEGIKVGPSPDWMQRRLEACGMRPINNVVDITNYVMLETGQPLHAFDADKLPSAHIVVRRARENETLRTLDDVARALTPAMLVIADAERPIALAGVMGGADSEVSEGTRRILLEAAYFAPLTVRAAARRVGLSTEASRRYERGVDPLLPARAAERAVELLRQHAGATSVGTPTEVVANTWQPATVTLRPTRANALLGLKLSEEAMIGLLERLGFGVAAADGALRVTTPSWRSDIEREIDLVEEVARMHGYLHIPTTLPRGANPSAGRSLAQRLEENAKSALLRCGISEVLTLSLTNRAAVERAGLQKEPDSELRVPLRNPLSDDFTQLRTSLVPSLLEVLARNARVEAATPPRIFELGKVYLARPGIGFATPEGQPQEKRMVGIAMLDAPQPPHWSKSATATDFYTLKAAVEAVLREMGAPSADFRAGQEPGFHPGRCAVVSIDAQDVGVLGEVHPDVAARYDLKRAYVAQIDFETLVRHVRITRSYAPLPRYPAAERDIAMVLDAQVTAERALDTLRAVAGEHLEALRVFDVYTGTPIPAGQKSMAVSLRFRAPDRTLRDEEVEAAMTRAREAARANLDAQLRE